MHAFRANCTGAHMPTAIFGRLIKWLFHVFVRLCVFFFIRSPCKCETFDSIDSPVSWLRISIEFTPYFLTTLWIVFCSIPFCFIITNAICGLKHCTFHRTHVTDQTIKEFNYRVITTRTIIYVYAERVCVLCNRIN